MPPPQKRPREPNNSSDNNKKEFVGRDAPRPVAGSPRHPFKADFNDHFETSVMALEDVLPAVVELRQLMRPSTPEQFLLYDPYYCSGTVAAQWLALGIQRPILHENRDFYDDIRRQLVPTERYDMLVTNPPFSEDHLPRFMHFLIHQHPREKPWAFLAPDYVALKPWYRELIRKHYQPAAFTPKGDVRRQLAASARPPPPPPPFLAAAATVATAEASSSAATEEKSDEAPASSPSTLGLEPFYIIPRESYDFAHPVGAGKAHSHFHSMWYVWPGSNTRRTAEVVRGATVAIMKAAAQKKRASPSVVHGLEALDAGKYISTSGGGARANPQRRQQRHPDKKHR